ncbi:MAG: caspase family protein [Bacteroidales bacterium]|nr:caspase family protein [Bacteroidales bacterium]
MHWSRLFFLLGCLLVSATLHAQKIYLMAVGVSDYPGTENDLRLPVEDAKAICRLYKTNSRATIVLLTDNKATKTEILAKARTLFAKAKEQDIVVFYFSGHGMNGGFVAYDGKLPYSDIRKLFAACKARNKMIFADACHAGNMRENKTGSSQDSDNNVMLFLSSRGEEYSFESPSMKNGYYTASLVGALKGGADTNRDRTITARELFMAVSQKVKELSGDRQHPVMWGNFENNMPVMIW